MQRGKDKKRGKRKDWGTFFSNLRGKDANYTSHTHWPLS